MTTDFLKSGKDWVNTALTLPVRFAQVREDPLLDLNVVRRLRPDCKILIIASGGCTVCALNTFNQIAEMVVVDPNPAQIVLSRLKLSMQRKVPIDNRAGLLGHTSLQPEIRSTRLTQLAEQENLELEALGPRSLIEKFGLDFIGRYEMVFWEIAQRLASDHDNIIGLLKITTSKDRFESLKTKRGLLDRLNSILKDVMSLSNLVELFGEEATRNRFQSFADHFYQRINWALTQLPTHTNHFLWQVLLSQSPPHLTVPWLSMKVLDRGPKVTFHENSIQAYLNDCEQSFDYIHLSNVLDWLSVEQARSLLQSVWNHLSPRGLTLIRQLNSKLNIPILNDRFQWLTQDAHELLKQDRSFFYRDLHLAQKS